MKNTRKLYWGIDLGGTKIECVALNEDLEPVIRERIATESEKGYDHILSRIKELLELCEKKLDEKVPSLGIGTPGTLDPQSGLLKNSNTVALNHKPIKKDLEKLLEVPVTIANDANCFALAETHLGVVKEISMEAETVLGLILGTGVGSGLVAHGKVLNGKHGIAGEWGHNFLDESGGMCYCGRIGCVETVVSGPALENYYAKKAAVELRLKDIVNEARKGSDKNAVDTLRRLIAYFSKAIAPVINILDPDIIILGGGVGNIDELINDSKSEIEKYLFNPELKTAIVKPSLGDSAGVFGAAMLVR
jgi:predicted NBD/HSP70 family sugar kinase